MPPPHPPQGEAARLEARNTSTHSVAWDKMQHFQGLRYLFCTIEVGSHSSLL